MQEKQIEQALVNATKKAGGKAIKFVAPGTAGMPDRLLIFPGPKIGFVETKAPGCKPRPLQTRRHEMLKNYGFQVHILDNPKHIPEVINAIQHA